MTKTKLDIVSPQFANYSENNVIVMSYSKSKARNNLQTVYSNIAARLKTAENRNIDPYLREYVVAAAIFLAHAEIENFISDLFSAFSSAAQENRTNGSSLPEELQSHLFLTKSNAKVIFAKYMAGNSEKDLIKAFSKVLRGMPGTIINDGTPSMMPFTGSDIYTSLKYPSADNLRRLFFRVGVDDIFTALNAQLKEDSAALLGSLGSLRTQLAHTGTLPGISCGDVRERLGAIERFVGALDRQMFKVTSSAFGTAVWKRYVS